MSIFAELFSVTVRTKQSIDLAHELLADLIENRDEPNYLAKQVDRLLDARNATANSADDLELGVLNDDLVANICTTHAGSQTIWMRLNQETREQILEKEMPNLPPESTIDIACEHNIDFVPTEVQVALSDIPIDTPTSTLIAKLYN